MLIHISLNYGSLPFNHQWMILISLIWSFTFTSWFINWVLYVMVISSTIIEVSVRFDTNIVSIVHYENHFLRHCLRWAQCCDPELTMSILGCNPITAHQYIMHWAITIQQHPTYINHTEIEKHQTVVVIIINLAVDEHWCGDCSVISAVHSLARDWH